MKTSRSHRGGESILLIFWASRPKIISSNFCPNQCAILKNSRPKIVVSHYNMCIKVFPNFVLLHNALFCIVQSFHFLLREIENIAPAEEVKQSENNKRDNVKRDWSSETHHEEPQAVILWLNYEDHLLRLLQGWIELTSCWLHKEKRAFSDVNDVTPLLIWLWGLLCDYYALLTSECKITTTAMSKLHTKIKHDYANWITDQSKSLPGFRVVTPLDGIHGYFRRLFRECTVGT